MALVEPVKCKCGKQANVIVHYEKLPGLKDEEPVPLCSEHYDSEDPEIGKYFQIGVKRVEVMN